MMPDVKPIFIIGYGGHARMLCEIALMNKLCIEGIIDSRSEILHPDPTVKPIFIGDDAEFLARFPAGSVKLINGVGSVNSPKHRQRIFERYKNAGFDFISLIHPLSIVSPSATLAEGIQIAAGAIVQTGAVLEDNVIINTGAIVDHDCKIAAHSHIAPGVAISGSVFIGPCTHVGTGAAIMQGVQVGADSTIGTGAVIFKDVPPQSTIVAYGRVINHG